LVVLDEVPQRGGIFADETALSVIITCNLSLLMQVIFDSMTPVCVLSSFLPLSPPQSLAQCVVAGKLSVVRFLQLQTASSLHRTHQNLCKRLLCCHLSNFDKDDDNHNPNADTASKNGPWHWGKRCVWGRMDETGKKVLLKSQESMWYMMYVSNPLINDDISMHAKFHKRFCIPYMNYLELVDDCTLDYRFQKWCGFKKNNWQASPIELLVLGALRYLGRGLTLKRSLHKICIISQDSK
jgi:hypothetical protein